MHNAARLAGIRRMLVKCDHVVAIGVLAWTSPLPVRTPPHRKLADRSGATVLHLELRVDMRQSISPYHSSLPLQHVRVYPAGEKSGASGQPAETPIPEQNY